jgi:hypothetical protein
MNLAPGQALAPGLSIALGGVLVPLAIVSFITSIVWYAITIAIIPSNGGRTVGIIIGAVIIYCLYRPHVKAYFGKGVR